MACIIRSTISFILPQTWKRERKKVKKERDRSVIWHHHLLCSTFDKVFLLNTKRRRLCRCFFPYTVFLIFFSSFGFFLFSCLLLVASCWCRYTTLSYSMCSVQYSRDIAWCCVYYNWKHTQALYTLANDVWMQTTFASNEKRNMDSLSFIPWIFFSVVLLLANQSLTPSLSHISAQIVEDIHNDNIKRWNCFESWLQLCKEPAKKKRITKS